jgi:hypothetical protein
VARKKATPKAETAPPPAAPTPVPMRVVVDSAIDTPSYYVNYAELHHSQHEFGIALVRLPGKLPAEKIAEIQKAGEFVVNADILLLVPPTLIPGLITALQIQQAAYEANFGPIKLEAAK